MARLRSHLRARDGELESLRRRLYEIENSRGWRLIQRVRPLVRTFLPPGSRRYRLASRLLTAIEGVLSQRWLLRPLRLIRSAARARVQQKGSLRQGAPFVQRLRVGCYGEYAWGVGGGTVHVLKFLQALSQYYQVDLLLPPGAPLRDRQWYIENLNIDIGDIAVKRYEPRAQDSYDIWFSAANEQIVFAETPKRFNIVFFPFVAQDGEGIHHVANSEYTASFVRARYGTQDVSVVYPSIDPGDFRPGLKEAVILHVSRFAVPSLFADKGHLVMIQAFRQLCQRGLQGWRLVLVGSTASEGEAVYASNLRSQAAGLPVEIMMNLSSKELRNLYASASIYWHATGFSVAEPGAQEHFGLTILEAMAAGAVPVAYNSGGPREIISQGKNGFLFDSAEELIDLTWDVANSPSLWHRLSKDARRRAHDFSDSVMKNALLATVSNTSKVSIIIGTHSNLPYLKKAIDSLFRYTPPGFELVVVDNGSTDGTGIFLSSIDYPHLKVIRNRANRSFASFNNQALQVAARPYVLFLNDDIELLPGWLEPLIEMLDAHPKVGAVGSRLLYPDGSVQHDGKLFRRSDLSPYHINMKGTPTKEESPVEVDDLTAACLLVRRELAGFPEVYRRGYYEDTDMCLRIKEQGYALVLHRGSVAIHYHGMSMGRDPAATQEALTKNRQIFLDRWGEKIPSLVHLASEGAFAKGQLRCLPLLPPEALRESWPFSRRLQR